ncbi:MAG TPA: hypothetical protein VK437_07960 [Steroidobacteraceae bacterium]|nr:hypothetical protein [Steroidobacteraceae bacterium]
MIGHEILQVTPIVEKLLRAQLLDQRIDDERIEALAEEFPAQVRGSVVAPRERIEGRDPRRAWIERRCALPAGDATPLSRRRRGSS